MPKQTYIKKRESISRLEKNYPYCPLSSQQHITSQHLKQPIHASPVKTCVSITTNWLFIRVQHWMQHMQQH